MVNELLRWLGEPFELELLRWVLAEVVVVGLTCGLVGSFVVLRRLTFLGEALPHTMFPGVVVAFLIGGSLFWGAGIAAVIAVVLVGILLRLRGLKEDIAIGLLFNVALAIGLVLISSQRGFARDLESFLFGQVLAIAPADLYLSLAVGGLVLLVLALFDKELLLVTFDRAQAAAQGLPVMGLDLLLLGLLALTVLASLQAVGNVLLVALLITPAATGRLLAYRFPTMLALAALSGALAGVIGLYLSYYQGWATGASMALSSTGLFLLALLLSPKAGLLAWARGRGKATDPTHRPPPPRGEGRGEGVSSTSREAAP